MKKTNKLCRTIVWAAALLLHLAPIYMIFAGNSNGHMTTAVSSLLLLLLMAADCVLMTVFDCGKKHTNIPKTANNNFFRELYHSSQMRGSNDILSETGSELS